MIEPLETLNAYLNNCFNIVDYFYVPKDEEFTNLSGIVVVLSGEYFDPCIEDISFISKKTQRKLDFYDKQRQYYCYCCVI